MSKKDRPQLPGPNERWRPQIVVQPPPAEQLYSRAWTSYGFLVSVGAVRSGPWRPSAVLPGGRGRGSRVRVVSNAVRSRLLRVWSLYWAWWYQDYEDRWWHKGSKWELACSLRALLLSFSREMRETIVNALAVSEAKVELWRLIRSTMYAKKIFRSSSGCERSARLEGRSPRSKSHPSSEATSLKPPASRAYEQRTRYR